MDFLLYPFMEISYPKQLAIGYYAAGFIAILLYTIGKISIVPMAIGLTLFALFFTVKAFSVFFADPESSTVNFLIYFGIAIQIALQNALLFSHEHRSLIVNSALVVCIAVFVLIYKFSKSKSLIPLNIVASIFTCTINLSVHNQ